MPADGRKVSFRFDQLPEAPVKSTLSDPGMAAMQKRLAGAKTNKMMKPPKMRPKTAMDFSKKVK